MYDAFTASTIDISMAFIAPFITQIDAGVPLVLLGGVTRDALSCSGPIA